MSVTNAATFNAMGGQGYEDRTTSEAVSEDSFYSAFAHQDEYPENDDFVSEELNVNWCLFFLRVASVVLMVCVITAMSLGELDIRLFYLAAIIFGVFATCLIGSFFDCFRRRFFTTSYFDHHDNRDLSGSLIEKRTSGGSLLIKESGPKNNT